jgi:predicted enzyme related to lactoylglutathione lyase
MAKMRAFYRDVLGLAPTDEAKPDEWVRFDAGGSALALHAIPAWIARGIEISDPPAARAAAAIKFTFHVDDVDAERTRLMARGANMGDVHQFGSLALCDGVDPEGNVFQISNR